MPAMSENYQRLLEATIRHLEDRKAQGVKFIPVSQETLAALVSPCARESDVADAPPNRSPARPLSTISMFASNVATPPPASAASSAPASPGAGPLDLQAKQAA